jgi:cytidylate kinase
LYILSLKNPQNFNILKKLVIAIDGPAASGKSTTSKLVAERLGYLNVDTGAMYRAITLKVLRSNIEPSDSDAIDKLVEDTSVRLEQMNDQIKVFLDNQDVTKDIRSPEVTAAVSAVSAIPKVRELMVRMQREIGKNGGVVLEGRDIGTVVFPDADLKIFMIANVDERAHRRQKDLERIGVQVNLEKLIEDINERDYKDSHRSLSPLKKAKDAIVLDTTNLTIDEQVDFIVNKAKEMMKKYDSQSR